MLVRLTAAALAAALAAAAAPAAAGPADPVRRAVARAERAGMIDGERADAYRETYARARELAARLDGLRQREMGSVLAGVRDIAARGRLGSSRMPAAFLTLRRNSEWWATRGIPVAGAPPGEVRRKRCVIGARGAGLRARAARLTFPGSRVVFQYYPGHGLQIQELANFAAANNYWQMRTPEGDRALGELLDELVALRSVRNGFATWEYYFAFGGGRPPWTSAISQGTAIQALSRAAVRLGRPGYFEVARQALGAFEKRTPAGVRVPLGADGRWYALYSFSPGLRVLNGHLQALNGLHDFAALANDARGRFLYAEGLRAARRRIAAFDTGAWSKYANPGIEADLNYHAVNASFARKLCERSREAAICGAGKRFARYLREPPRIGPLRIGRPRRGRPAGVRFFLSKVSDVSVYVKRGKRVVRSVSGFHYRGLRRLAFAAPEGPGGYRIDVFACDLAGNATDRRGRLEVR